MGKRKTFLIALITLTAFIALSCSDGSSGPEPKSVYMASSKVSDYIKKQ